MSRSLQDHALLNDTTGVVKSVAGWLNQSGIRATRLLIGVSGGADSVALLRAVDQCRSPFGLDILIGHLDHRLRSGSSSDADWVSALGERLGVPVFRREVNVARLSFETGRGIEETARQARYGFFLEAASESGCSYVAVAHTADDQAETILHHIVRGTGLSGLQGMPAFRQLSSEVTLIRPLLGTSRQSIIEYLNGLGQEYLVDHSNTDEQFTRNRLRHRLLPLLRDQFNPQVTQALLRLSQQATDAQAIVEVLARSELETALLESTHQCVRLKAEHLARLSPHLLREVFRQVWLVQDWPRQRMGFETWQRLALLVQSAESAKSLSLPHDLSATLKGAILVITQAG